jgi:hypothetical protein
MTEKFSCRTKIISGITYNLTIFRKDGSLAGYCGTFSTKESADSFAEKMTDENTRVEIHAKEWTREVCIECGHESW